MNAVRYEIIEQQSAIRNKFLLYEDFAYIGLYYSRSDAEKKMQKLVKSRPKVYKYDQHGKPIWDEKNPSYF